MEPEFKRLKIREAAAELNVCCRTIHNRIKKYKGIADSTKDALLPSTPTNGLRGTTIGKGKSERNTWRVDSRDLADYIANGEREAAGRKLRNWRVKK